MSWLQQKMCTHNVYEVETVRTVTTTMKLFRRILCHKCGKVIVGYEEYDKVAEAMAAEVEARVKGVANGTT